MVKNITVIDAQGNEYGATYPRRAKGLVKNGRARFVNETTICLAGPPEYAEGKQTNMEDILTNENDKEFDIPEAAADKQQDRAYIMEKIDQILADNQYLRDIVAKLGEHNLDSVGISNMVESREKTNQAMIRLLEKMLEEQSAVSGKEDLQLQQLELERQKLGMALDFLKNSGMDDEYVADAVNQIIQKLL